MTPGDRVVHVIAVVQVEAVLAAETITQATELYGERTLVTDERVRRFVTGRLRPQLKMSAVQTTHLQMLQR